MEGWEEVGEGGDGWAGVGMRWTREDGERGRGGGAITWLGFRRQRRGGPQGSGAALPAEACCRPCAAALPPGSGAGSGTPRPWPSTSPHWPAEATAAAALPPCCRTVLPAGRVTDSPTGEDNRGVDEDVPPELIPPADLAAARTLTGELRTAIAMVRRDVAVLAERVDQAHQARVWLVLGYRSWGDYAHGELGISRAQAYRLVTIADTARELRATARAHGLSLTGDDLGLSGRALQDLHGRADEVAAALAARLATSSAGDVEDVAALLREVARDLRAHPPPALHPERPEVAQAHSLVTQLRDQAASIGRLVLEIAPAYQADADVADVVALFADDIGASLPEALAYRRYAITGDPRALDIDEHDRPV
jgi:hypothetical protein